MCSRILKQCDWSSGLEPAVTSFILQAQVQGLNALSMLVSDWANVRYAAPKTMTVQRQEDGSLVFDAAGCHALVAAPSILDHLIAAEPNADITVSDCPRAKTLAPLEQLALRFGKRINVTIAGEDSALFSRPITVAPVSAGYLETAYRDILLPEVLWRELSTLAAKYLIPESEVSRSHAGDGTSG